MVITIDIELDAVQLTDLEAIARREGKAVPEVVEEAVTRYADRLRSKSPAELEAYISAMRARPEGEG